MQDLKLLSGNANQKLAEDVAAYLGIQVARSEVGTFSDGECNVEIGENVRGKDCFIFEPLRLHQQLPATQECPR